VFVNFKRRGCRQIDSKRGERYVDSGNPGCRCNPAQFSGVVAGELLPTLIDH
jgi:hypothetical protein